MCSLRYLNGRTLSPFPAEAGQFTLYMDDSGTDPNQKVAVATLFRVPNSQIPRFEEEWNTFGRKMEFSCFHTSEFMARNPKSEFARWDIDKQRRVFERVCQIAKKFGVRALSVAVNKKDYDEPMPQEFRHYFGPYHYTWAVRQIVSFVGSWYEQNPSAPYEFVFQWMGGPRDPRRREVETVMEQAQWRADRSEILGDYSHYSFCKSDGIPGLQCVDAIAWVSYQYALNVFYRIQPSNMALQAWHGFEGHLGSKGWLFAVTIVREKLRRTIEKSLLTGKSKQYFRDWERYKAKTDVHSRRVVR